jgi:hypothetical protein
LIGVAVVVSVVVIAYLVVVVVVVVAVFHASDCKKSLQNRRSYLKVVDW